jgi:NNP family nitrate/nitrite transporter-like MFS transporter
MIDATAGKATRIQLLSFSTPPMRAFHLSWMALFVCFFAGFAVSPLTPIIKAEFGLSKDQITDINIAASGVTMLGRLAMGPMCHKWGPRLVHSALLALGAIPVFGMVFATSYNAFVVCRLLLGAIGASFVVAQYHTSVNFAPNVVGAANAASAGWGNSGAGVAQSAMPLVLTAALSVGVSEEMAWRFSMIVPGALMLLVAWGYWNWTQDCPEGNYAELRALGIGIEGGNEDSWAVFRRATANYRSWMLFLIYGACFGIELFVHGVAASYYVDRFKLDLRLAGLAAGCFGLLALFARVLAGLLSDHLAKAYGLDARTRLLFVLMLGEGAGLVWFSLARTAATAVLAMVTFGLFTHMACGATYALVPFIEREALGGVGGIVGAGGNVGAVVAGFLFKAVDAGACFAVLGVSAFGTAFCAIAVRFSDPHRARERALYERAVIDRRRATGVSLAMNHGEKYMKRLGRAR